MTEGLVPLSVVESKAMGTRQVLLALRRDGSGFSDAHTTPGQYARLAFEDGVPRPYALASAPGSVAFEFLLKVPPERAASLLALGPDDRVLMGKPQGKGFPMEQAQGRSLWMFAVGSGVAPLRAVVEHLLPQRSSVGEVSLFYGVRDAAELAFTQRFGAWSGYGIRVVPVVSQPKEGSWDGKVGHIQDHLPKAFEDPERVVAFLCGLPEMDRDLTAALLARGVGPSQVFRNW